MFFPTFLYIKFHTVTGKYYFGKTIKTDPEKYHGSGLHWKSHIKKHGKEFIETPWYCLFLNEKECTEFAILFSNLHNIVESNMWLNLKMENGTDGNTKGTKFGHRIFSAEHCKNLSIGKKGKPAKNKGIIYGPEIRNKMRISQLGKQRTDSHVRNIILSRKGKPHPIGKEICPHCHIEGGKNTMRRWHFNNCKLKPL